MKMILIALIVLLSNGCSIALHKSLYNSIVDEGESISFVRNSMKKFKTETVYKNGERFVRSSTDSELDLNESEVSTDDHKYYRSTYYSAGSHYFTDLAKNNIGDIVVTKSKALSSAYLVATKVLLAFNFTFYGNRVNSIYVTTGGFLSVYPLFHSYIHYIHYIAPLMANFNLKQNNNSAVYYGVGRDKFIVQWDNVQLNQSDSVNNTFTFQVTIYKNGTFLMAYKNIPYSLYNISNTDHPVTAGIADGFLVTFMKNNPFIKRPVIHTLIQKYHEVSLPLEKLRSYTAYKLDPLKTCNEFTTCESCTGSNISFQCSWCPGVMLCSDIYSWKREVWRSSECDVKSFSSLSKCALIAPTKVVKKESFVGIVIGITFLILCFILISWFVYGYLHPQSRLGMWLIENRPSTWFHAKSGEIDEDSSKMLQINT